MIVAHPPTVTIPAGSFLMGACPDDKFSNDAELPRRVVEIEKPFELGVHPVTLAEWRAFDPTHDPDSRDDLPVVSVSFLDIACYLAWLNDKLPDQGWRLPDEEEWEYACRAGTGTIFSSGDQLEKADANFLFDEAIERVGPGGRTPVGSYPPNPWGLFDMHGNVSEWTSSTWKSDLRAESEAIPHRFTIKGGAWDYLPRLLRCSWRDGLVETSRRDNLGFRVARDLVQKR